MSSLVGHALGGIVAASAAAGAIKPVERRSFFLLIALTSLLADFDVVVFLLFSSPEITPHRGASHSLLFATAIASLLTVLCARLFTFSKGRLFACFFAAYSSHLLLDYLMGSGPEVPFFWPLSYRGYLAPVQLVPTAYYGLSVAAWMDVLISWRTYAGIALELVIFVPLVCLTAGRTGFNRTDLVMLTAAGVAATAVLYN